MLFFVENDAAVYTIDGTSRVDSIIVMTGF